MQSHITYGVTSDRPTQSEKRKAHEMAIESAKRQDGFLGIMSSKIVSHSPYIGVVYFEKEEL